MLKITTGDYEIIASGLAHLLADEESVIILAGLEIKILFKDDGGQPSIEGENENEKTIKITFSNFKNSLGQGNTKPMEIGKANEKKLFLTFRIFSLKEKNIRTFEYTFYLKNE